MEMHYAIADNDFTTNQYFHLILDQSKIIKYVLKLNWDFRLVSTSWQRRPSCYESSRVA